MTPQEAINKLNDLKQYYNDKNEDSYVGFDDEDNEALDMAIKALEQQPCEDAISRKDTLNKINALIAEYIPIMPVRWTLPLNIAKTINELPSVTPMTEWIPCSERLPEKNGNYLVTVKYKPERDYDDIYTEYGEWRDGEWDVSGEYCGVIEDIIAWMPLPEPYKTESEEDVCKDCYYNDGEVHAECVTCDNTESEDKE